MQGSFTENDRINLYNKADKIIFNSNWTKEKFLKNLSIDTNDKKITIIPQSTSKVKVDFSKKKKLFRLLANSTKQKDMIFLVML